MAEGSISADEISQGRLVDKHYYAIASKAVPRKLVGAAAGPSIHRPLFADGRPVLCCARRLGRSEFIPLTEAPLLVNDRPCRASLSELRRELIRRLTRPLFDDGRPC